jgi:hypothetical protein
MRVGYSNMGFHPAWKYEIVHELIFEDGRLTQETDWSEKMAHIRQQFEQEINYEGEDPTIPDADASKDEIHKWISDCFSRAYGEI